MSEPVLLVVAVPQEIDPFHGANGHRDDFVYVTTGIGSRKTLARVRHELRTARYRAVVSAGFAGATQPGFKPGDIVISSEVIEAGSSGRWVPGIDAGSLRDLGSVGRFITSDRAAHLPEKKEQMGRDYGTIAVDMETAAVARAATEAKVPWIGFRVILDPMEMTLVIRSLAQGIRFALWPPRWPRLLSFTRSIQSAGESLAVGLDHLLSRI